MKSWRTTRALLLFWLVQTGLALWLLMDVMGLVLPGIAMHVAVIGTLLMVLLLPHMIGSRAPWPLRRRRLGLALSFSVPHALLIIFYLSVGVTEQKWGAVVTLSLIKNYVLQLRYLPIEFAYGSLIFLAVATAFWLLLFAIYYRISRPLLAEFDRALASARRLLGRPVIPAVLPVLSVLGLVLVVYMQTRYLWVYLEPIHGLRGEGVYVRISPPSLFFTPRPDYESVHRRQPLPPATRPLRPLVLITIDALRSDHMQVYGYPEKTTPFLSSLYAQGKLQRYDDTYGLCTVSFCGLLGTLSSKYWHQLNKPPENLADILKQYGYKNYFVLSGDHSSFYGLRQQYGPNLDFYLDGSMPGKAYANDDRLVTNWLVRREYSQQHPVFMYFHLMATHEIAQRLPEYRHWLPDDHVSYGVTDQAHHLVAFRNNYLNGTLQADQLLARIFASLETQGLLKDALVIITADHGEHLGRNGLFGHGGKPDADVSRIPLLIYDASGEHYPARALSSQVDIAPTLLHAVGIPVPSDWSGIPLQLKTGRKTIAVASYEASGIIVDGPVPGRRSEYLRDRRDNSESLFHLDTDAGETTNLAGRETARHELEALREQHRQLAGEAAARLSIGPLIH